MLKATYKKYILNFNQPGGTSRGVMTEKETWFIVLQDEAVPELAGIGECGIFRGLSSDDTPDYESKLKEVCDRINEYEYWLSEGLNDWPSIQFGLETAIFDLLKGGQRLLFPSEFTSGMASIPINGLIWMGDPDFMKKQIAEKLSSGFDCIKIKIGALPFNTELDILWEIRKDFGPGEVELRVDANGAFSPFEVLEKLKHLADLQIHSIEQPIHARYKDLYAELADKSPVAIALDEQLIGVNTAEAKLDLLKSLDPSYIVMKPSLVGGIKGCHEWIHACAETDTGWWITSALESNVGLNAIAQFTYSLGVKMPQGLGTGQVFSNNFDSPLQVNRGMLYHMPDDPWKLDPITSA